MDQLLGSRIPHRHGGVRGIFTRLRGRLIVIFVSLAIGPSVLLAAMIGRRAFVGLEQQSHAMQQEVALRVANQVAAYVMDRIDELETLDEVYGFGVQDEAAQHTTLSALLLSTSTYQEFAILDLSGQELYRISRTTVILPGDLVNRAERPEFLVPLADDRPYVGPVRFDSQLREPLAVIALPMIDRRRGEPVGVLLAEVRFGPIWNLLGETRFPEGGDAYVVDPTGSVVAHRNPAVVLAGTKVDLSSEVGRGIGLSGIEVILAKERIQLADQEMFVIAEQAVSQALAIAISGTRFLLATTGLALLVAVAMVIYAVRQIVNPIESLAESVREIEAGDFSVSSEEFTQDEIGILASALNSMRARLRYLFEGMELEIAQRKRIEETLREANARLQELDRMKSKFVADISHELRTPVSNLLLYIDLLRNGSTDRRTHYETMLGEQGERLAGLLNRILDFTAFEQGLDTNECSPLDLNQLVAREVADHRHLAEEKRLELTASLDDEIRPVWGDPNLLEEVVHQLLSNAICYTAAGEVRISTKQDPEKDLAQLVVEDTGIGLDGEDLEHCFERFYRGRRIAQYNLVPGAGLGLSKVQEIIRFHKGCIEVESEVDRGSTFTVYVPTCGES